MITPNNIRRRLQNLVTAFLLLLAVTVQAGGEVDFSGSYTLKPSKSDLKAKKIVDSTLKVVQSATAIEVTTISDGKTNSNKYPLDGNEGDYVSPGRVPGKCKAQFKGKVLFLESTLVVRPVTNGPAVQMHMKERWELSADGRKLTIHVDVDYPNMPVNPIEPWPEVYTRNESGEK